MSAGANFDNTSDCPVSPKTTFTSLDDTKIIINEFESSSLSSSDKDRNYHYNHLSQFRFPNYAAEPKSTENTTLDPPFKPSSATPSTPQSTSPTQDTFSPSTPRYTPSHSFHLQTTTTPSRRSSHKRSIAISISSSSIDSIFSDVHKMSLQDDSAASRASSVESYSSDDPLTFARKLEFMDVPKPVKCTRKPSDHHQCRRDSLPLPLIDLDIAAHDPKPRLLNSFSPSRKHNACSLFNENDTIIEEEAGEGTSSSNFDSYEEFEDCREFEQNDSYETQNTGEEDIDLVNFLKETAVKETLEECEIKSKTRVSQLKNQEECNPFLYLQAETQAVSSPLCTPTASQQSFF